jgi:hypothetical protein
MNPRNGIPRLVATVAKLGCVITTAQGWPDFVRLLVLVAATAE